MFLSVQHNIITEEKANKFGLHCNLSNIRVRSERDGALLPIEIHRNTVKLHTTTVDLAQSTRAV